MGEALDDGPRRDPRQGGDAPPPSPSPGVSRDIVTWGTWVSAGFEFAAAVVLFFLLGSWLDATWATHPWMRVTGALTGSVVGTYALIRKALASDRRNEPHDRRPPREGDPP